MIKGKFLTESRLSGDITVPWDSCAVERFNFSAKEIFDLELIETIQRGAVLYYLEEVKVPTVPANQHTSQDGTQVIGECPCGWLVMGHEAKCSQCGRELDWRRI